MTWMIYQFLAHTIDVKRNSLIEKLVTNGVLSPDERETIRKLNAKVKANSLLMMLGEKSAAEFDSFLATLS